LVVNSSQGGGSKDTWVLDAPASRTEPAEPDDSELEADDIIGVAPPPQPETDPDPATPAKTEPPRDSEPAPLPMPPLPPLAPLPPLPPLPNVVPLTIGRPAGGPAGVQQQSQPEQQQQGPSEATGRSSPSC
jgi:hypothetical protein